MRSTRICLGGLAFAMFAATALQASSSEVKWPKPPFAPSKLPATPECQTFETYTFSRQGADEDRVGIRTDGVVVVHHNQVVFQKYARGYDAEKPHLAWSVTKSIVHALVGVAVKEGRVHLSDKVKKYYPEEQNADMTVLDLLQMSSGIKWREDYENDPTDSSVVNMLYLRGRKDMAAFTARQPVEAPGPGQKWQYNSGNSNLLMGILKNVYSPQDYATMPWTRLFDVLGMVNTTFERDEAGTFIGASYLYATPLALAKFGYLYLNNGRWENQPVLPPGWVTMAHSVVPAYQSATTHIANASIEGVGGPHWWLNVAIPEKHLERPYPHAPADTLLALGHWGQLIAVIPSLDMVVVRTADDRDDTFQIDTFLEDATHCFAP